MNRLIVALALPVLAAACNAPPAEPDQGIFTLGWAKFGVGFEAFVNDRNDCVMASSVATQNAAGREQAMPAVSASRFKSCLRARGWEPNAAGYSAPLGYNVRIVQ